jgi:hypothetical protein
MGHRRLKKNNPHSYRYLTMLEIPLIAVPNQSLSIRLDNNFYTLNIKQARNTMAVDVLRNNDIVVQSQRALPSYRLIPYEYLENGNFIFVTENWEYPFYTQFAITQFLYFVTQAELESIRAAVA